MLVYPPRGSALLLLWLGLPLVAAACGFSSPNGSGGGGDDDGGDGGDDVMPGCADDDKDSVCNDVDKCAGHDDRLDGDGDKISDGCDDWPCGVKPDDPGGGIADEGSEGRNWGASFISIGDNRRIVVSAGQPFNARFMWTIYIDCGSGQSSCRVQVEYGYGPTRAGCLFDNVVSERTLISSIYNSQLTAPSMSGLHELRLNVGRRQACGDSLQPWYDSDPGSDSTIAYVCVR